MKQKSLSAITAFGMIVGLIAAPVSAAQYPTYFSDGAVKYEKTLSESVEGREITFSITKGDAEIKSGWKYAASTIINENGSNSFEFV